MKFTSVSQALRMYAPWGRNSESLGVVCNNVAVQRAIRTHGKRLGCHLGASGKRHVVLFTTEDIVADCPASLATFLAEDPTGRLGIWSPSSSDKRLKFAVTEAVWMSEFDNCGEVQEFLV